MPQTIVFKALALILATWILALGILSAQTAATDTWKLETLYRKQGDSMKGFLVEESAKQVVFKCIIRKPGAPTLLFTEIFDPKDVLRVEKLPEAERKILSSRLDSLAKERELLATSLKLLDPKTNQGKNIQEIVKLEKTSWPLPPQKTDAMKYASQYFILTTNSRPELAQLAAIQLEQVFSAYARTLPPKRKSFLPTSILLTRSLEDYQQALKGNSIQMGNPAYFDQKQNLVLCGSDLDRMNTQLEETAKHHQAELESLARRETDMKQLFKNKLPADYQNAFQENRKRIQQAEATNRELLRKTRLKLFERLYHEAFHAYLSNCVLDEADEELPRWLNEGLAQIFESAVFEIGELRVGHADKPRLEAIRLLVNQNSLPEIRTLLQAKADFFLVSHESTREVSEKMYLASWGLAFHLAFRSKVLSGNPLHDYARAIKGKQDPIAAFERLTGKSLDAFQKEHIQYLKTLRQDGTSPLQ